jgi:hypothetical protein
MVGRSLCRVDVRWCEMASLQESSQTGGGRGDIRVGRPSLSALPSITSMSPHPLHLRIPNRQPTYQTSALSNTHNPTTNPIHFRPQIIRPSNLSVLLGPLQTCRSEAVLLLGRACTAAMRPAWAGGLLESFSLRADTTEARVEREPWRSGRRAGDELDDIVQRAWCASG